MLISVQVKPGSTKAPLVETQADGSLLVHVKERAVDGQANEGLIAVLAKHLDIPKRSITIKSGHAARRKIISVDN